MAMIQLVAMEDLRREIEKQKDINEQLVNQKQKLEGELLEIRAVLCQKESQKLLDNKIVNIDTKKRDSCLL